MEFIYFILIYLLTFVKHRGIFHRTPTNIEARNGAKSAQPHAKVPHKQCYLKGCILLKKHLQKNIFKTY